MCNIGLKLNLTSNTASAISKRCNTSGTFGFDGNNWGVVDGGAGAGVSLTAAAGLFAETAKNRLDILTTCERKRIRSNGTMMLSLSGRGVLLVFD